MVWTESYIMKSSYDILGNFQVFGVSTTAKSFSEYKNKHFIQELHFKWRV